MKDFIEYIENSCKNLKDTQLSYLYKKKILQEITDRANEITHAGLKDEKVLADLLSDEYPNLEENYYKFEKEEKKKSFWRLMRIVLPITTIIYFISFFVAYFEISYATKAWRETWLIIVGGIFSILVFYFALAIHKLRHMRRIFHPIARLLLIACVMLITVFTFLFVLMMFNFNSTWPIIPAGIAAALVSDLIFAFVTKQKFRTVCAFVYTPIVTTMLYIILSAYKIISWSGGWPFIILGFVLDLVYVLGIVAGNAKYFMYKQEEDD